MVTPRAEALPAAVRAPWLWMYLRPTTAFRAVLDEDPRRHVAMFVGLSAFAVALGICVGADLWRSPPWPLESPSHDWPASVVGTVVFAALIALPLAWLALHVVALMAWWIGRMLGGTGRFVEIRCAMAWSFAPALVLSAWPLMESLDGHGMPPAVTLVGAPAFAAAAVVTTLFLAEAHRIPVRVAFGTAVISACVLVVVASSVASLGERVLRYLVFLCIGGGGGLEWAH